MRWKMLPLAVAALAVLGFSAPARAEVVPEEVRESFRQASPEGRLAAWKVLQARYPDLREEVRAHLDSRFPNLEIRTARAALRVGVQNPGLAWSLPRHLLVDLGGEPLQAMLDVRAAVLEKYPDFPERMAALRRECRQAFLPLAREFPSLRTDLLDTLGTEVPGAFLRVRREVLSVLAERHFDLPLAVLRDVSRLVDEKYPDLPEELRRSGERPGPWLAKNRPGFLGEAFARVAAGEGGRLRGAAVDILARLEKSEPDTPRQVAEAVLGVVESKYPTLPARVREIRAASRQELKRRTLEEFPGLPDLVAGTMAEKHPDLVDRALACVEKHYPALRNQARAALAEELPGLESEVRSFLDHRHPTLFQDLQRALATGTSG